MKWLREHFWWSMALAVAVGLAVLWLLHCAWRWFKRRPVTPATSAPTGFEEATSANLKQLPQIQQNFLQALAQALKFGHSKNALYFSVNQDTSLNLWSTADGEVLDKLIFGQAVALSKVHKLGRFEFTSRNSNGISTLDLR